MPEILHQLAEALAVTIRLWVSLPKPSAARCRASKKLDKCLSLTKVGEHLNLIDDCVQIRGYVAHQSFMIASRNT